MNIDTNFLIFFQNDTLLESIKGTNKSLTVVTAFFTIGSFPKGTLHTVRTSNTYNVWMRTFLFMKNPVIFYTDNKTYADFFVALRKDASLLTESVHLNRSELWAFQIIPKIKKIYSTPGYPQHYQNHFFSGIYQSDPLQTAGARQRCSKESVRYRLLLLVGRRIF